MVHKPLPVQVACRIGIPTRTDVTPNAFIGVMAAGFCLSVE